MPRRNVRVLLVDDEETDLAATRDALESDGHSVQTAADYPGAMAVFEAFRDAFDLLIIDVSLPGGNGCDLAMTIWKQRPGIPVLFISGHVGAEVCRYYGLDVADKNFLRKPFTAAQLKESVRRVLASPETTPRLYPARTRTSSGNF
jgi:DNA-binding response OmpR family regulator